MASPDADEWTGDGEIEDWSPVQDYAEIIKSMDSLAEKSVPFVNPTVIYNEGWITRLLVQQSIEEKVNFSGIDLGELKKSDFLLIDSQSLSII